MMYYGIRNNNFALVDYALENGADINTISDNVYVGYENTIHEAIEVNSFPNWNMIRYLIDKGADTNYIVSSVYDISILIGKIKNQSILELESAIIFANSSKTDINIEDTSGHNALFWAIDIAINNENADMYMRLISTLIEKGVKVSDKALKRALHPYLQSQFYDFASGDGLYTMTKMVLEAADNQGVKFPYSDILHDAIVGNTEAVSQKVKKGDFNALELETERRAVLFYTAAYGSVDTLKLIMEKGNYNFDVKRIDEKTVCSTLLDAAALGNNVEVTEYLIQFE